MLSVDLVFPLQSYVLHIERVAVADKLREKYKKRGGWVNGFIIDKLNGLTQLKKRCNP